MLAEGLHEVNWYGGELAKFLTVSWEMAGFLTDSWETLR